MHKLNQHISAKSKPMPSTFAFDHNYAYIDNIDKDTGAVNKI